MRPLGKTGAALISAIAAITGSMDLLLGPQRDTGPTERPAKTPDGAKMAAAEAKRQRKAAKRAADAVRAKARGA